MRAYVVVVVLLACGSPQTTQSAAPMALPSSPVSSASSSASRAPVANDPVARVQEVIPHMLDLLTRGEDERFIDEVVVPEELDKVLGSRTKAELVADFKGDKHDEVVKLLERVRKAAPSEVSQAVDGAHVYVHN